MLIPNVHSFGDDGTLLFVSHDWEERWRSTPKPPGEYQTTFAVPGNFFSEGRVTIKVAISTYKPFEIHFVEADVVAFTIIESSGVATSRGDYAGYLPGIVRPLLVSQTDRIGA